MPDFDVFRRHCDFLHQAVRDGKVRAMHAVGQAGLLRRWYKWRLAIALALPLMTSSPYRNSSISGMELFLLKLMKHTHLGKRRSRVPRWRNERSCRHYGSRYRHCPDRFAEGMGRTAQQYSGLRVKVLLMILHCLLYDLWSQTQ